MKVLLIQLRRLGDLILTTPALGALRKQLPRSEVSLAVAPESSALLPAIHGISETIIAPARGDWRRVRRARFDCVVDITRNDRSAFLTAISGAPRRIVSHRARIKSPVRALFYNEFVDCAVKQMHTADYCLALLRPVGIQNGLPEPHLDLPASATARAAALLERELHDEPFALFHPGSARPEKFWPAAHWAEVIAFAARELGLRPVLTGGTAAAETAHLMEIRRELRCPLLDLTGKLDLLTLAAVIEHARLAVTVDSAPMHLASAMRTPLVALFGPTNPFHWRPRGNRAAVLFGASSEPARGFQPRAPRKSMNVISTLAVINAMRAMLSAPTASAV